MKKTIPLNYEFRQANRAVKLDFKFNRNKRLVVWWYCGVYKNNKDMSQPIALVGFRELINGNSLSEEMVFERFPLTVLGQLRIGSIWLNGKCQSELIFTSKIFDLDFSQGGWQLNNFERNSISPFPQEIHPLKYSRDKNWLVCFNLREGTLAIPTLELFTRHYGRSAELRRCLATYAWDVLQEERFFSALPVSEEEGQWVVALGPRLFDGDAVLIAHTKYDVYARKAAKEIHAQLAVQFGQNESNREPAYLKIGPWHQGTAQLRVEGIEYNNGASFLGLRITGCSNLNSPDINVIKEVGPGVNGENEQEVSGRARRQRLNPLEPVELTSAQAPDADAVSVEIKDPDFEILGDFNPIVPRYRVKGERSATPNRPATDASLFSSGASHGNLKGVGYAHIHAKPVLESQGVLRDMWNAMLFLAQQHPRNINSIMWYTMEDGFSDALEPSLIAFEPYEKHKAPKAKTTRYWPYLVPDELTLRGALVMRVRVNGQSIYVVEIQRRSQKKKNEDGSLMDAEESFQGLVFRLDEQNSLNLWLANLLSEARSVRGVLQRLVSQCPGKAATFKHSSASGDQVPCEAAARNALKKVGVFL